jgi:hypothetical protein
MVVAHASVPPTAPLIALENSIANDKIIAISEYPGPGHEALDLGKLVGCQT